MSTDLQLGSAIRRLRLAAGRSQRDFSEEIGVDQAYLSRLENGKREPSIRLLRQIARSVDGAAGVLIALALLNESPDEERARFEGLMRSLLDVSAARARASRGRPT